MPNIVNKSPVPKGVVGRTNRESKRPQLKPYFVRQAQGPIAHEDFTVWARDRSDALRLFFVVNRLHGKAHLYVMQVYDVDPDSPLAKKAPRQTDLDRDSHVMPTAAMAAAGALLPEGVLETADAS